MNASNNALDLLIPSTHIIIELIEASGTGLSKTLIKKTDENISISSLKEEVEEEQVNLEKSIPFDTYVQVIEGVADLTIGQKMFKLKLGEGMIIPAFSGHNYSTTGNFKILSTILKPGFE